MIINEYKYNWNSQGKRNILLDNYQFFIYMTQINNYYALRAHL